jgi:hypothetical protein
MIRRRRLAEQYARDSVGLYDRHGCVDPVTGQLDWIPAQLLHAAAAACSSDQIRR